MDLNFLGHKEHLLVIHRRLLILDSFSFTIFTLGFLFLRFHLHFGSDSVGMGMGVSVVFAPVMDLVQCQLGSNGLSSWSYTSNSCLIGFAGTVPQNTDLPK